jgi:hypothetical protein
MAGYEKQGAGKLAQKAPKALSAPPFCAFCALSPGACFPRESVGGVTVEDVLDVFGGRIVAAVDRPMPAGHVELFEAARQRGFPWLRLRPGYAVGRGEDAWCAWLGGWVSPADLVVARARLARGEGIA